MKYDDTLWHGIDVLAAGTYDILNVIGSGTYNVLRIIAFPVWVLGKLFSSKEM